MTKTTRRDRYAKLDSDTFDRILADVINEQNPRPADVLSIPGVYEILSEHYNNDVLSAYDDEQAITNDQASERAEAAEAAADDQEQTER